MSRPKVREEPKLDLSTLPKEAIALIEQLTRYSEHCAWSFRPERSNYRTCGQYLQALEGTRRTIGDCAWCRAQAALKEVGIDVQTTY